MAGEWREVRLGDLVAERALSISDGYRVRNEELGPDGIPFVRGGDIGDGWINTDTVDHVRPELADRVRSKLAYPGDVAFITKGTVGRAGRLRAGQPAVVFAPQVAYWRVEEPDVLDSRFLFYLIRSREFQSALDGVKTHGAMVADYVSISQQLDFSFQIPDIDSQRAIGHVLGTLDDKIELNRRMNETLEAIAWALFKSWFVDFDSVRARAEGRDTELPQSLADLFPDSLEDSELDEIPKGWGVYPLPDVIEVNPPRPLRKGDVAPYLDMANMPTVGHSPDVVIDRPFGSGMRFMNGDTLVARITPCLENGKTAYVDFLDDERVGWGSTEYIVLRPKPPLPPEFAYCLARSSSFRDFAVQSMTGSSGRQRVPAESLSHFRIVSPPQRVAELFGRLIEPLFARASAATRQCRTLVALRDSLLPKLVSGELRVPKSEQYPEPDA